MNNFGYFWQKMGNLLFSSLVSLIASSSTSTSSRAGCLLNKLATKAKFKFFCPCTMSLGVTNSLHSVIKQKMCHENS